MAINYILPVRAVQAVLSITVLGLMSYGSSPFLITISISTASFILY
jgi:hypothetical protein